MYTLDVNILSYQKLFSITNLSHILAVGGISDCGGMFIWEPRSTGFGHFKQSPKPAALVGA